VGAAVANAKFTSPPPPTLTASTGGLYQMAPYTWATADQSYPVAWSDGDTDPTGRFYFHYLDHCPDFAVVTDQIEQIAPVVPGVAGQGIWASCSCSADAGVNCPDAGDRTANGMCANQFTWDTSQLPAGAYWLIAVNNDPPFHVYSVAQAPVIVSHGGTPPPAAIIVRPDTIGSYSTSYTTQWAATGSGPLHFDLSYGAVTPTMLLASDVHTTAGGDGTLSWLWDVSQLMNGVYFLEVKVTDALGQSSFTDSRYGLTVFRTPGDGGSFTIVDAAVQAPDMAAPPPPSRAGGCKSCSRSAAAAQGSAAPLALLLVLAAWARRRLGGRR
jgi:hypothetical protein